MQELLAIILMGIPKQRVLKRDQDEKLNQIKKMDCNQIQCYF